MPWKFPLRERERERLKPGQAHDVNAETLSGTLLANQDSSIGVEARIRTGRHGFDPWQEFFSI
jgi:hypothetical protein